MFCEYIRLHKRKDLLNYPIKDGRTALFVAASLGDVQSAHELLRSGASASISRSDGATALYVAAASGHIAVTTLLLGYHADTEKATGTDGSTPLFVACQNGHHKVVKTLLAQGADANKPTHAGATPMLVAALKGHFDILTLLIENGGKIGGRDVDPARVVVETHM